MTQITAQLRLEETSGDHLIPGSLRTSWPGPRPANYCMSPMMETPHIQFHTVASRKTSEKIIKENK